MAEKPKIKIKDTRKYDAVSGKKLTAKNRMHADIYTEQLKDIIKHSKLNGIDPYTALAIGLQETNLGVKDPNNMFQIAQNSGYYNEMWDNPYGAATKFMKEKFDLAKKLGKTTDEDIIQAWNGYGSLKNKGVMYGIDTNKTPINTKLNPVYGKRIVNLRDSVIKTNPDIVNLVDKYEKGGEMKKQNKTRYRVVDLYDGQMYDVGGWLDDALIGAGTGAMSGAALGPIGAIAGGVLGAITGGIGGNKQAEAEEEARRRERALNKTIMPSTVGLQNTTGTVMPFKNGGKIEKVMREFKRGKLHSGSKKGPIVKNRKQAIAIALSEAGMSKYPDGGEMLEQGSNDLIEIEGPSHEQGGVQYMPDAELEGGETVHNNIVSSDSWIITEELAEQYGLPKQSIGKTPGEYNKIINNKYKDREVDPFAMKSKEMELNNVDQMSMEIANMIKGNKYQTGGKLKKKNSYNNPFEIPQANIYGDKNNYILEGISQIQLPILASPLAGLQKNKPELVFNDYGIAGNNNVSNPTKVAGAGLNKVLGAAPIIMGGINALRSIAEGPEDPVRLGRVHYDPMHPEFIDPAYQLRAAEDTFATGNQQMSQQSKKDWLRRRTQSATEEAKTKSGILGQTQAANTQMLNQVKERNQLNRMQVNEMNLNLGLQEENINAANKGAWETNRDYQLNNLATMTGEYARDRRMEEEDKAYRDRWLNTVGTMFGGQKLNPNTLQWENEGPGLAVPQNGYVYQSNQTKLPPLQEKTPVQYEDLDIANPSNYNFYNKNRSLLRPIRFGR